MSISPSNYTHFVQTLAKPGDSLLGEWDARKANLIHMTLGLATELFEWKIAVFNFNRDRTNKENIKNIFEEVGDIFFYANEIVRVLHGINLFSYIPLYLHERYMVDTSSKASSSIWAAIEFGDTPVDDLAENILSSLKGHLMYNKDQQDLLDVFAELVIRCSAYAMFSKRGASYREAILEEFCNGDFLSFIQKCIEGNVRKLEKRYPGGKFSNLDASQRADKV